MNCSSKFFEPIVSSTPSLSGLASIAVADVSIVFGTDGQIAADKLVVLEDDKKLFPPYNVSLIVNDKSAKEAGADMPKIVEAVQKDLTAKVMQELNSRVDLDKEKPADVAREYLQSFGYTEKSGSS